MSEDCHSSDNAGAGGIKLPRPTGNELVNERLDRFKGMMKVVVIRKGGKWYAFDPCDNDVSRLFMMLPPGIYDFEIKLVPVETYRSMVAIGDPVRHLTQ